MKLLTVLRRGLLLALVAPAMLPSSLAAKRRDNRLQVVVNVDVTEEGRKAPRPDPEQPAYYVPVILGWNERGKIIAGEQPPSREDMLRQVARALAREGYVLQALRPDANETLPSLIIALEWGYLNPDAIESGALDLATDSTGGSLSPGGLRSDPTQSTTTDFNQAEMIALIAGSAVHRQSSLTEAEWQRLGAAAAEGRYYIILSAYDFEASTRGEQKLLWRARMSTERHGVWMSNVVSALVTAGAPHFGRETDKPTWSGFPLRDGKVDIGAAEVAEFDVKLSTEATLPAQPAKSP